MACGGREIQRLCVLFAILGAAAYCQAAQSIDVIVQPQRSGQGGTLHVAVHACDGPVSWVYQPASRSDSPDAPRQAIGWLGAVCQGRSCLNHPGQVLPIMGLNQRGMSVSAQSAPRTDAAAINADCGKILSTCSDLDEVYNLLRAAGQEQRGETAGIFGICPGADPAAHYEYHRSADGKRLGLREFRLDQPGRARLDREYGGPINLQYLGVRTAGAFHGSGYQRGRGLLDSYRGMEKLARLPDQSAAGTYLWALRRLQRLIDRRRLDLPGLLAQRGSLLPGLVRDCPGLEGSAGGMIVQHAENPALTTLWTLPGPNRTTIAVPLWLHAFVETEAEMPAPLAMTHEKWSLAGLAEQLGARDDAARVGQALGQAEQRQVAAVQQRLQTRWDRANLDDASVRRTIAEQMLRVQETIASDSLSVMQAQLAAKGRINYAPVVSIEAAEEKNLICRFQFAAEDVEDGKIAAGLWDYGDGRTGAGLSHTYDQPGEYLVSLTVIDTHGARQTDWRIVRVGGYDRIRRGDRPIDDLRKPQFRRPAEPVTARDSAALSLLQAGRDYTIPILASAAASALLAMGGLSCLIARRRKNR